MSIFLGRPLLSNHPSFFGGNGQFVFYIKTNNFIACILNAVR